MNEVLPMPPPDQGGSDGVGSHGNVVSPFSRHGCRNPLRTGGKCNAPQDDETVGVTPQEETVGRMRALGIPLLILNGEDN